MTEFIAIVTGFPTVIFSVLLIAVMVFWLLSIVGVADIDLLDMDVDINAETDASGIGPLAGLLLRFGLHGIPVTVVVSVLVLMCWALSYFGSLFLLSWLPGPIFKGIGGMALVGVCLAIALPLTAASLRPMRNVFAGESAMRNAEVVGRRCEVRSLEVSESFGQGLVADDGAGLLIDIRAEEPNSLTKGDLVAVIEYLPETGTYRVVPEREFMGL